MQTVIEKLKKKKKECKLEPWGKTKGENDGPLRNQGEPLHCGSPIQCPAAVKVGASLEELSPGVRRHAAQRQSLHLRFIT